MSLTQIKTIEHLKKDETIKEGLFLCQKCNVIFSSYYLRTFSVNCVRAVTFGKCKVCEGGTPRKAKRLFNNSCLDCKKVIANTWEVLCGQVLTKLEYQDFEYFCVEASKIFPLKINIDSGIIESLFEELSSTDFLSMASKSEIGYTQANIATLIEKKAINYYSGKRKRAVNYQG